MEVRAAPDLHAVEERLFARLARGQLLLLVGAGASRWAGLPSWRETVCALAEDLPSPLRDRVPGARDRFVPPGRDERVSMESLLRIPEAHRFLCGEARLVERLSALFDTSGIDPAGLPLHHALVRLSAFVPAIYTTNFDDLLERTFAWAGRRCQVVAGPEDLKAWRVDEEGGRFLPRYPIYKLHGTLGRPGSLVVGEQDFLRRSDLASNPIDLRFCSDVMGRELLLVGYGFNDPNMRWILGEAARPRGAAGGLAPRARQLDRPRARHDGDGRDRPGGPRRARAGPPAGAAPPPRRARRPRRARSPRAGRGRRRYSTQSAMKTFVSPGRRPFRFEAKTSFRPSGENMGNPSNASLAVIRSRPVPSSFTM